MIDLIIQRAEDSDRHEKLDLEKAAAAPEEILIKGGTQLARFIPSLTGPDILAFIPLRSEFRIGLRLAPYYTCD
jgi:hypothetical protein